MGIGSSSFAKRIPSTRLEAKGLGGFKCYKMYYIEFKVNLKFYDFVFLLLPMGILLAHVSVEKFKISQKKCNLMKSEVFFDKLELSYALISGELNLTKLTPDRKTVTKKCKK